MRIRQVVLVARDLESTVADLRAVFDSEVCFRDPGVAEFGLVNALLPFGDTFLEVISPVRPDAPAARYRERQGADGGYMMLVQCDDLDADVGRVTRMGVRIVWKGDLPDIRGRHLHPADTGGTLLSLDQPVPAASWRWAGPEWERKVRAATGTIVAAEMRARDPQALSHRWAEILGRDARPASGGAFEIPLDQGTLRFVRARDGESERLSGFDVAGADRERILDAARARGASVDEAAVGLCGVTFRLL